MLKIVVSVKDTHAVYSIIEQVAYGDMEAAVLVGIRARKMISSRLAGPDHEARYKITVEPA